MDPTKLRASERHKRRYAMAAERRDPSCQRTRTELA